MAMLHKSPLLLLFGLMSIGSFAQVCDPSVTPSGLVSTYTPGTGALLQWNAVPGSIGVQIKATSPSGGNVTRRIIGFERGQFLVPDALLSPGTYTWQVQAACSTIPPYSVTPVSVADAFTVGGSVSCPAAVSDIDGNVYNTVEINGQCWMQENLKVERYRNGDAIATGLSNSDWTTANSGAFAVYDDHAPNKASYGLLYNFYAVADARGLCPIGWHVPTDSQYVQLTLYLGGTATAGGEMKSTGTMLAGTGLWEEPNLGATNNSGFSGLPNGFRSFFGDYTEKGTQALWWTITEFNSTSAWNRRLNVYTTSANRFTANKQNGFAVRCLKE